MRGNPIIRYTLYSVSEGGGTALVREGMVRQGEEREEGRGEQERLEGDSY